MPAGEADGEVAVGALDHLGGAPAAGDVPAGDVDGHREQGQRGRGDVLDVELAGLDAVAQDVGDDPVDLLAQVDDLGLVLEREVAELELDDATQLVVLGVPAREAADDRAEGLGGEAASEAAATRRSRARAWPRRLISKSSFSLDEKCT